MVKEDKKPLNGGLASLSPECLDQLCDRIIARLEGWDQWRLASQARRRGFESHHPLHSRWPNYILFPSPVLTGCSPSSSDSKLRNPSPIPLKNTPVPTKCSYDH